MTKVSASCSNVPARTKITPKVALNQIATPGVWNRRSTLAIGLKRRPSAAVAKSTRDPVITEPLRVPKVEIITATETNATPTRPTNLSATSAATSFEWRISSTGSTARYATFASR